MQLEIFIEEKAKKLIQEKGNILSISRVDIMRGCASIEELDVSYRKPQKENYRMYKCDEVIVYVQVGVQFQDNCIKVVVSGIGPFKAIVAGNLKQGVWND